ncbi:DNA-binding response regulator [Helicobacter valdiviensis]|uniref:DNA-binding response regulator n=1 Tax=Helicobacter valdiviensis TaxID=1458358 RepID=A0A2W6MYW7_9HELI|nr:response regulator transcription factor [Helicobacter valdiviensis]PZT48528.1 DNA-binding response regulator [Helicobacter valdiviensis]
MVYILEDESSILELVLYALKSQNIEAKGFSNAQDFFEELKNKLPKVVILDVMLPGIGGFEVLEKLKKSPKTRNIGVLMLTALSSEYEKVKGLDLGADDYITKPFGVMELLARVRVILRRLENKEEEILLDGLEFSTRSHRVVVDGKRIELTLKEFELLGFLLKNIDRTFSRDELFEVLWGYSYTNESRTLDVHIKTLRQKLGSWGSKIKTIRGIGYKIEVE